MAGITESLRSVLFPGYFGTSEITADTLRFHVGHTLDDIRRTLEIQVRRGLGFRCEENENAQCLDEKARAITDTFLQTLPHGPTSLGRRRSSSL